jgi:hypothetical protein
VPGASPGLNEAVGGLLTNVALDGQFAISGTKVLSDNLRIRSDRLNATAVIVADLARGEYRAGLQGGSTIIWSVASACSTSPATSMS